MIKALRITSIIAAVSAVVLFVLPAVFGVSGDKQIDEFLNSPGVIEKFNKTRGDKAQTSKSQISPLVKQAKAFALYLNPPPKPKKTTPVRKPTATRRPPSVSPKFKLIGTCYYELHPEMSLALIDEPGKGFRWVRQSNKVGHLIFEQVEDGLVVVRDGKRTYEVPVAERPPRISLVKGKGAPAGKTSPKPTLPALGKTGAGIARSKSTRELPQVSAEENAALMKKLIAQLKIMQADSGADKAASEHLVQEGAELIDKFISDPEAESSGPPGAVNDAGGPRVSAEEAKKLDRLGRKLRDGRRRRLLSKRPQQDPNQPKDRSNKIEAGSAEPNNPDKK